MYEIIYSKQFKKDYKLAVKRNLDIAALHSVITLLANGKTLPSKNKDHALKGEYYGYRECHIQPDWLLMYRINETQLELLLSRTGTHSDLF
ncbi:MAG: type II toxin-antitoxin system YafQ family toxin [Prevotellaceae bacterium]|jgi:mRNA interferase YafQ|nr:type II toxin-antitoxin system YafQ family toxin [Prevotellaceae bacterium]